MVLVIGICLNTSTIVLQKFQRLRNENVIALLKTIEILQLQHWNFINFELSIVAAALKFY